jgi:phosphohistidine phosphatase
MLRLVLSRHANAAPHAPGGDKDRPLNTRGLGEAMRMGRYLADQRIRPSIAVVSDARRTRETMEILLRELASHATIHVQPDLYHAEPVDMLAMMRGTPDWVKVLLVIGHNPALSGYARALVGSGDPQMTARLNAADFVTCGMAVIDFPAPVWSEVEFGSGRLDRYVTPAIVAGDHTDAD